MKNLGEAIAESSLSCHGVKMTVEPWGNIVLGPAATQKIACDLFM